MSSRSTTFIAKLCYRVSSTIAALLFAASSIFNSASAVADQPSVGVGLLSAYCADPINNTDKLQKLIRSRLGSLPSDASYDNVVDAVFDRLDEICSNGAIPKEVGDQMARLNTIVRDKRVDEIRRPKGEEFQDEVSGWTQSQSDVAVDEILDVIRKQATTRQQMVFNLLVEGMTQQEVADRLGVAIGTVNGEKNRLADLLKRELQISDRPPFNAASRAAEIPLPETDASAGKAEAAATAGLTETGPLMTRVQSPLGAELLAAMKSGSEALPTGAGYAGPVMSITLPSSKLSTPPINGIVMLPVPIIMKSNAEGEQEMVVTAVREIGDVGAGMRTFALYAFCKDEALETPSDLSRYSFKSEVTDPKVIDIVTRSDLRQPEVISGRLWDHFSGG